MLGPVLIVLSFVAFGVWKRKKHRVATLSLADDPGPAVGVGMFSNPLFPAFPPSNGLRQGSGVSDVGNIASTGGSWGAQAGSAHAAFIGGGETAADPEHMMAPGMMARVLQDGYVAGSDLLRSMGVNVPGGGGTRSGVEDVPRVDGQLHPSDPGDGYLLAGFLIPFAAEDQAVTGPAPPATATDHSAHPGAERHHLTAGAEATRALYANDTFTGEESRVANMSPPLSRTSDRGERVDFEAVAGKGIIITITRPSKEVGFGLVLGTKASGITRIADVTPGSPSHGLIRSHDGLLSINLLKCMHMEHDDIAAEIAKSLTLSLVIDRNLAAADVGTRVQVVGYTYPGTLRFVGMHASKGTPRCGVELDRPIGKNDGMVSGHRYFACAKKCGVLVTPDKVILTEGQDGGGGDPVRHSSDSESNVQSQTYVNVVRQRAAPKAEKGRGGVSRQAYENVGFEEPAGPAAPRAIRIACDASGPYNEVVTMGQCGQQAAVDATGADGARPSNADPSHAEATTVQDQQQRDLSALRSMVLNAKEHAAASSGQATAALHPAVLATAMAAKPRKGYENVEEPVGPAAPGAIRIARDVRGPYNEVVTMGQCGQQAVVDGSAGTSEDYEPAERLNQELEWVPRSRAFSAGLRDAVRRPTKAGHASTGASSEDYEPADRLNHQEWVPLAAARRASHR